MKKTITLISYRRTHHKNILCPDGQERSFDTYRVAFQNGKKKVYHASVLYWYKQDKYSAVCCTCPAGDYRRRCYHLDAIMQDPKLQALIKGDKQ
jgi:hypothetical protein